MANDQLEIDVMFWEQDQLARIERDYYETEGPKVMKSIKEWIMEFPLRERNDMRARYIQEQIPEARKAGDLEYLEQLVWEGKALQGKVFGVTSEQIRRAQEYPIEKLIKHKNLMALCPFHKEKTPSFNLRKNFYYCHGCQESGNSITFLMKTKDISFREAVNYLSAK